MLRMTTRPLCTSRASSRCTAPEPLPVSAAFHSRYMADAAREFEAFLAPFQFSAPRTPVIANLSAQPYPADGEAAKALLVGQITGSVRWVESVRYLAAQGVDRFEEMGPGNVLARLVQQIRAAWPRSPDRWRPGRASVRPPGGGGGGMALDSLPDD